MGRLSNLKKASKGSDRKKRSLKLIKDSGLADDLELKKAPERIERIQKAPTEGQTVSQTLRQTVRHSSGHSDRHSSGHSSRHSDRHSGKQSDAILSPSQQTVLEHINSLPDGITRLSNIASSTSIPYGTVRGSISALYQRGIIAKPKRYRDGMFQGVRLVVRDNQAEKYLRHSGRQSGRQTLWQTVSKNTLEEDNIYNLLEARLDYIFSNLYAIGFEKSQLREVVKAWKVQNIDLKLLPVSLERADFAIKNKTFKADNQLAYVYKSLMRGQFAKPPKFKSRGELAVESADPEEMKIVSAKLKKRLAGKQ